MNATQKQIVEKAAKELQVYKTKIETVSIKLSELVEELNAAAAEHEEVSGEGVEDEDALTLGGVVDELDDVGTDLESALETLATF